MRNSATYFSVIFDVLLETQVSLVTYLSAILCAIATDAHKHSFLQFSAAANCLILVHCMAAELFISKASHNQRMCFLHSIGCKMQSQLQLILSQNYRFLKH